MAGDGTGESTNACEHKDVDCPICDGDEEKKTFVAWRGP